MEKTPSAVTGGIREEEQGKKSRAIESYFAYLKDLASVLTVLKAGLPGAREMGETLTRDVM